MRLEEDVDTESINAMYEMGNTDGLIAAVGLLLIQQARERADSARDWGYAMAGGGLLILVLSALFMWLDLA